MEASYITSAAKAEQLPRFNLPEIAFIGRSNSGKSTLLNALLERKNLARHGKVPGQTQMINFFNVDNRFVFADLPGYGYSATAKDARKHWEALVDAYLHRTNIMEFLFLMDCRRELGEDDLELLGHLSETSQLRVILTKTDKLSRSELNRAVASVTATLQHAGIAYDAMAAVSSLKKSGIEELRSDLFERLEDEAPKM